MGGKKSYSEEKKCGNISSGSSKTSISIEIKVIKRKVLHSTSGTKNKKEKIIRGKIWKIRSPPIKNNKYIANNEKLSDFSDSIIENLNYRNKKLFIGNTKTKEKSSNDNNSNVQNHNMMQIIQYTGTNGKYRKDQYTKIKRIKTIQKSSSLSPHNNNSSVGTPSRMKQNKLHSITYNLHSCTYEKRKIIQQ